MLQIATLLALVSVTLHGKTIEIPDPLALESGQKVTSVKQWQTERRPQLLELFRREVYGRAPIGRPADLKFKVTGLQKDAMNGAATRKQITISFVGPNGRGAMHVTLFVPNRVKSAAPCFLLINHRGHQNADPTRAVQSPFWPAEAIVARGYAAAVFDVAELDPDEDDGFKNGVHGLFDARDQPRAHDTWGTIAAWAWGASRAMDYLQNDAQIDGHKIAIVGHSRGGKTALWAGAQDERFALVVSNDSGNTGAALSRGKEGENIAKINATFPYWFCQNYHRYDNHESELPVDQHELLALIAPRPLYIASATEDLWSDPEAEWQSGVAASPVYALFGAKGLPSTALPAPETSLNNGRIGHHLRTGKHDLTPYDWAQFMNFADKQWGHVSPK